MTSPDHRLGWLTFGAAWSWPWEQRNLALWEMPCAWGTRTLPVLGSLLKAAALQTALASLMTLCLELPLYLKPPGIRCKHW